MALVTVLYTGVSLVTMASSPGLYVGDDRFEKYFSPGLRLLRELSIWDANRGFGRVREDFWPGTTLPVAMLRGLGASPAFAEHLWHAMLLVVGGLGVVVLMRIFRPHVGIEHGVAGFIYMFNPFSATFFIPSGLYFSYAIAPWLLASFVKGVRSQHPWRWAAAFALLVFLAGDVDIPGLVYVVVPIVPMAVYLVHIEREVTWRRVGAWLLRAAALCVIVSAAVLVKLVYGASAFAQRLDTTESPNRLNLASSWTESWRGLGFWLSYFRDQFGLTRPQGAVFFQSWPVVAATFALPLAAIAAVWRSKWRARLAFLGIALVALLLMVGTFPVGNPSPYGRLLLFAYDHVPGLSGFRNNYKAGAGLMIGVAVLCGVAAATFVHYFARLRVWLRAIFVVVGAVVVLGASLPFWNGQLYAGNTQLKAVPSYWRDAFSWLDRQPDDGRVLVLPGSTRTAYRWGWVGDDIFDALLRRPHVVDTAIPLSTPEAADLLAALSRRIEQGDYRPGELAPLARRFGVRYVLLRNDLDWARTSAPRPERLDPVRSDPDLHLVSTFGSQGQDVAANSDHSLDADRERGLPPVEIYEIPAVGSPIQATTSTSPLIVSGNGDAWPALARDGLLNDGRPVAYSGDLSTTDLIRALDSGSPVVVTDTNRRRLVEVSGPRRRLSYTLAAGENLDRPTAELFPAPESESVAVFGDAKSVTASSVGTPAAGFQPWFRPGNAFDGNEGTAWEGAGLQRAVGSWLRVQLRRRTTLSEAVLVAAPQTGRRPSRATIQFSDGSTVPVDLSTGRAHVTFRPRATTSIEIRIDSVVGRGLNSVGFAEVSFPHLNLAESVQVPQDLAVAARTSQKVRGLLTAAPLEYEFLRQAGDGPQDEELVMHRAFSVVGPRDVALDGTARIGPATPDRLIDTIAGGSTGAWGSARYLGTVNGSGQFAVDGREDTGWLTDPRPGETLNVRFPRQPVHHVEVDAAVGRGFSRPTQVTVTVGDVEVPVQMPPTNCPTDQSKTAPSCIVTFAADVPSVTTDHLVVRLDAVTVASGGGFADLPVSLPEVRYQAAANIPVAADAHPVGCLPYVVSLDRRPIRIGLDGTVAALLAGEPVPFHGCDGATLDSGPHGLDTSDTLLVDELRLHSGWPPPVVPSTSAPSVEVLEKSPTHFRLRVNADHPTLVTIGQSFDRRWQATLDGRPLRSPVPVDTTTGWTLPRGGVLDVRYQPQRTFEIALIVSFAGLILCGYLFARRRSRT